jgi:hypothetical protein
MYAFVRYFGDVKREYATIRGLKIALYLFWLEMRITPPSDHPHPSLLPSRAVKGRFLLTRWLKSHKYWVLV